MDSESNLKCFLHNDLICWAYLWDRHKIFSWTRLQLKWTLVLRKTRWIFNLLLQHMAWRKQRWQTGLRPIRGGVYEDLSYMTKNYSVLLLPVIVKGVVRSSFTRKYMYSQGEFFFFYIFDTVFFNKHAININGARGYWIGSCKKKGVYLMKKSQSFWIILLNLCFVKLL